MKPTATQVHYDSILTNISVRYKNGLYIADQVFPSVEVGKQSDRYYVWDAGPWFRDEADKRAPGARSKGGGFTLSTDTFFCEEWAFHTLLADEDRDNADSILRLETNKTNFVTEKIFLKKEREVAALIQSAAAWPDAAIGVKWDDYDLSDPITDIQTAINTVEDATGYLPNTMVMGNVTWRVLRHHPQILDRLPVTGMKQASLNTLRDLFEIDKILVGKARYNSAKEGQTDVYAQIWSDNLWVGYVAPAPAKEEATAGYSFVWPRDGKLRGVRRWRDEDHHSEKIEAYECYDLKVVGSDLGYLLRDTNT